MNCVYCNERFKKEDEIVVIYNHGYVHDEECKNEFCHENFIGFSTTYRELLERKKLRDELNGKIKVISCKGKGGIHYYEK